MQSVIAPGNFSRLMWSPRGMGAILAGIGFIVWTGLSVLGGATAEIGSGLREAWDTTAYFYLGVPLMALAVGFAAFVRPSRPWRWPLWLVGGHQIGVLLVGLGMQSGLSLLLLTLMLAVLLAALFSVPALIGALARLYLAERAS
jgi:hypothetical protein